MRAWHARRGSGDEGTIGILTLGFTVVALMLILVVASATAVHLARLRLTHLADEMAIDAADAVAAEAYFDPTAAADISLAQQRMAQAASTHLTRADTSRLDGVRVVSVTTTDGHTARVTVSVVVYPLFGVEALMPFADGITLTATGTSRGF